MRMKPNWSMYSNNYSHWRGYWECILSQDHFVVDLPFSNMDRFLSAADWGLNQREMEPIHQVENGEYRTSWNRSVGTKLWHTFDWLRELRLHYFLEFLV
jgi:hypothetical protein